VLQSTTPSALGLYGGGARKPWSYLDDGGSLDRRTGGGTGGRQTAIFGGTATAGHLDTHYYQPGGRTGARSLGGASYDSLLYRCSTSNV